MKEFLLLLVMAAVTGNAVFAQQEENEGKGITPPAAVKAAFTKGFPGSSKVRWEKEGTDYEVNFIQQKKEMSAVYNAKGQWKETEVVIPVSQLPDAVKAYIKQHYNNAAITEAARITKANSLVNYEAEVKGKDVVFDANGKFIKAEK